MGIFKKFIKGSYTISIICPNCGFGSEVKIPRGISVADFVKGGQCKCENCLVVSFPEEYTTRHFEKKKSNKKDMNIKPKHNEDYIPELPPKNKGDIKW